MREGRPRVLVSLTQLVETIHNICKVRGSNLNHHKKRKEGRARELRARDFRLRDDREKWKF